MSFIVGLIVNGILLSIPIGATLGTLFGIRPFRNEREPEIVEQNAIIITSFCDDTHEFHQFSQNKNGVNYTVNSNEILPELESTLCLTITQNQNNTYPSNTTAPDFSITWEYPFTAANESSPANETKPLIHAFPQAALQDTDLPITLEDLSALNLELSWTMGIGDSNAPSTSLRRLAAQEVNASVALDMYMDADPDNAAEAGKATFEMIVFFAKYGLQDPVGFGNGTVVTTAKVGGVEFDLFAGKNDNLQNVFSWVAQDPATDFKGDISLLFNNILNLATTVTGFADLGVDLPGFGDFVGYVGFGTQAYNSIGHVTFHVPTLSMDLVNFVTLTKE